MARVKAVTTVCNACFADRDRVECGCNAGTYRLVSWDCDRCNMEVTTSGGRDVQCSHCHAWYNAAGQRLRDDWQGNPSLYDSEVGDLEGYELQHANDW